MKLKDLQNLANEATPIQWAPGYAVDRHGNVWSLSSNWRGYGARPLTPFPDDDGYLFVRLMVEHRRHKIAVHKLVAAAFLPARPSLAHEIRHLNGFNQDNQDTNLAWGTRKENAADRTRHGRCKGAENGRRGVIKLVGRYRPICHRGHDKCGQKRCEECRREQRRRERSA